MLRDIIEYDKHVYLRYFRFYLLLRISEGSEICVI